MTASTLLFYISVCLVGQVVLAVAYSLLRTRREPGLEPAATQGPEEGASPSRQAAAWPGLRAFTVVQRTAEDSAGSQCSFYLAPCDGQALPDFKPGQFLTFSLSVPVVGRESPQAVTRCYSLSDSPTPDHYRITVKRVPAPAGQDGVPPGLSSNHFHDHLPAGSVVMVRAPSGHFHLDADSLAPIVLVAGGIGVTPMVSMLRWCQQHQPQRPVHFFYGVRNGNEHAFKHMLQDNAAQSPAVQLHVVYSRPLPTDVAQVDYQHTGYVDIALLKQTLPHGAHQFYICGPSALMESLVPALSDWGVPAADIHFEAFGPASVRLPQATAEAAGPATAQAFSIHFKRSGRTLQWTGKDVNLLDFAERHGVTVESGCRSGSCGSCATPVSSGSVAYSHAPDFDLASGQCLLCVGTPRTALVLEA